MLNSEEIKPVALVIVEAYTTTVIYLATTIKMYKARGLSAMQLLNKYYFMWDWICGKVPTKHQLSQERRHFPYPHLCTFWLHT